MGNLDSSNEFESNVMIDLKLLMFWPGETGKERNKKEAIDVISAELATCLFVERFEFF